MLLLLLGAAAWAQETSGSIRGAATDPSGAVVPYAHVRAIEVETGFTRQTTSDARGGYLLLLLPVGQYRSEGGPTRLGQSYAVNGQRPESNEFLIGVENYNTVNAGLVLEPGFLAFQDFRLTKSKTLEVRAEVFNIQFPSFGNSRARHRRAWSSWR